MADIKRPNYFTGQFLVASDLDAEQSYHLGSHRRHDRTLHASGVVEGLDVTLVSGTQIRVGPGTAIDRDGREIVLVDPRTYTLASASVGADVHLTIAYQEVFDPADQYTQTGLNEFTRTTERPLLQDGTALPPTDGSVIVLARIRLSNLGAIESNASIDTSVRSLAGATIAVRAVTTVQLADGAVTLPKLAPEVQPLSVEGANAIRVTTDAAAKRITVGETHSARTDNPHATTAAQVDAQGGANRLVAQINAGTGVIARGRVESAIVSGVVTFEQVPFSSNEVVSDEIDPGFGPGPVNVAFALEDVPVLGSTMRADAGFGRTLILRSEVNRATGRFRVFATRTSGSTTEQVRVRWFASGPAAAPKAGVATSVTGSSGSATPIDSEIQVSVAT